ncbi:hypothetical protein GY15_20855 [Delftia sp. 670]|nr:hypothetical protein GY15_20855 [Delftia sp. 670]
MKAVPSCAAQAPRPSAAAMPSPSMMPPAAITGRAVLRASTRTRAKVPIMRSCAGSNVPRCPPASTPWATMASTPACSTWRASSSDVALARVTTPAARSASMKPCSGSPK